MADLTFFSKTPITCPVCESSFYREELRTGRGRLNAGDLTAELRRTYLPSQKFGEVFPLVYPVTVCPSCYYATFQQDFAEIPPEAVEKIRTEEQRRIKDTRLLFDSLDFTAPRGLEEGCASYYLATACYEHFPAEMSPTFKKGLCCLRAAWVCNDLHRKRPNDNFDYLARVFYRKARFFYAYAVALEQTGKETLSGAANLGPDLDKNYGYDGVLYLTGLLEYKFGPKKDPDKRRTALERAKRTVARIFGMGKASKNKPAAILDNARDVYEEITKELGEENRDPEAAAANA
ncbi:MAG: DUF2225 domain-containing protein [Spirochaetota bacterium]